MTRSPRLNTTLVQVLASSGLAYTAEWAFTVAIGLVAYSDGGSFAVGAIAILRLLPSALVSPVLSTYADRLGRARALVATSILRGAATLAIAPVLLLDGATVAVYALAVVSTLAFTPYRPSLCALLPSLCQDPDELTRVNVLRGAVYSVSLVLGPLVAAVLVGSTGVAAVFAFAGALSLVAGVVMLRAHERTVVPRSGPHRRVLTDLREGFGAVSADRHVLVVVALIFVQTFLRGVVTVMVVVVAIDLLDSGEAAVGVLQGAIGVGALVGSLATTLLVGSRTMARWLGLAVVSWGFPLAAVGAVPDVGVALVAFGVIGLGATFADVIGFTLLARLVPDAVLGRVYGVRDGIGSMGVCLGALAAPVLDHVLGARVALLVLGALAPFACAAAWHGLARIDEVVEVRTDVIRLLRQVPILRPLHIPEIEQLAGAALTEVRPAGSTVFAAGTLGDGFYVVAEGEVQIVDRGRVVRTMGPGEGFGEIALLGQSTRTMTVRTTSAATLMMIRGTLFVAVLAGSAEASAAAERVRDQHLDHAPGIGAVKRS